MHCSVVTNLKCKRQGRLLVDVDIFTPTHDLQDHGRHLVRATPKRMLSCVNAGALEAAVSHVCLPSLWADCPQWRKPRSDCSWPNSADRGKVRNTERSTNQRTLKQTTPLGRRSALS